MENASRDGNHVPSALGVSPDDITQTVNFRVDAATGRLLTASGDTARQKLVAGEYVSADIDASLTGPISTFYPIFTVPAGKSAIVTLVSYELVAANAPGSSQIITTGFTPSTYEDYTPSNYTGLTLLKDPGTQILMFPRTTYPNGLGQPTPATIAPAGSVIGAYVYGLSDVDVYTIRVRIFGTLI